jgi:hypothetical protein
MDNGTGAEATDQVEAFMAPLPMFPAHPTRAIFEAVDYVVAEGPSARRPVLGEVSLEPDHREYIAVFGNRLREIRPLGTDVRILCIFGPDRTLVLLYAGDKAGEWKRWYATAIKEAARLYIEYLKETRQDGKES